MSSGPSPVVCPVMAGPPQGPLLRGHRAQQCQQELEQAAGPVRAVGEVAVVAGGDGEHAQAVGPQAQRHPGPGNPDEEDGEARQVGREERDAAQPVDPFVGFGGVGDLCGGGDRRWHAFNMISRPCPQCHGFITSCCLPGAARSAGGSARADNGGRPAVVNPVTRLDRCPAPVRGQSGTEDSLKLFSFPHYRPSSGRRCRLCRPALIA
jgi:hypothetical protein